VSIPDPAAQAHTTTIVTHLERPWWSNVIIITTSTIIIMVVAAAAAAEGVEAAAVVEAAAGTTMEAVADRIITITRISRRERRASGLETAD